MSLHAVQVFNQIKSLFTICATPTLLSLLSLCLGQCSLIACYFLLWSSYASLPPCVILSEKRITQTKHTCALEENLNVWNNDHFNKPPQFRNEIYLWIDPIQLNYYDWRVYMNNFQTDWVRVRVSLRWICLLHLCAYLGCGPIHWE